MKKVISLVLALVMLLSLAVPTTVYAAADGSFSTVIEKTSVKNDGQETFDVEINVDEDIDGVAGLELHLKFDVDQLEMAEKATKVSSLSMQATAPDQANKGGTTEGTVKFMFEDPEMEGVKVSKGTLYTVKFKVKAGAATGICKPDLFVEVLNDRDANPMRSAVSSLASVAITAPTPAHTCSADTLTEIPAKAHTCTEDGNYKYYRCTCGELYEDADAKIPTTAEKVIDKAAHTDLKLYPEKAPTCTDDGYIAYWFCTGCDNYYFDNDGAVGAETTVEKVAISATGHKWELVVGGYADGAPNHTIKCSVCGQKKDEAHADHPGDVRDDVWQHDGTNHWNVYGCGTIMNKAAHTWNEGVVTKGATCTELGEKTFTCNVCKATKTEPIPVIAHQYEWKHDETNHWQECSVCHDIIDKAEHTYASHKCEDTATCTKAGCGYVKSAGQHSWNDGEVTTPATCTTDGVKTYTCKVCSETKTEPIKASGHSLTKVEAVAATCTEGGNNEYYTCSVCKKVFKADKTTETTVADETLAALGHSMTKTEAKAATCTEAGNNEYYTCGNCGKFFSDEAGENEIKQDSWVIDALKHDFTGAWVNTDAAGHYHKCTRCDATDTVIKHTFNGKPCTEADNCTVCGYVKAAGVHAWGAAEYKWSDDYKSCTATIKCTNCEAVETDTAIIGIDTTPATCTVDGKTVYTATFSSNLFTTKPKEVTIDKLGHTYGAPVWSWSEDGKTATATFTCTREGCTAETTGHVQTVTATVSGKQKVAPTCTDKGTTTYTAKVTFEKKDYADTKDVQDIKALGHKLTKTPAKAATCTEPGNNEYWTCSVCKKVFKADKTTETTVAAETLAALGHKLTQTPAKAATCVAEGNNEYYTCSVCHKVFKDEQGNTLTTVAAETLAKDPANHTGGTEQRGAVAASCMTAGRTDDTYCKGCGKLTKAGDLIPPTGVHNYKDGVCTTCGSKQPADNATIKAAIEKVVADVKEAVEEVLDKAIKNETDANTKKILEKLKGYVSGSSRSKLQAVYSVTMSLNGQDLDKGDSLADGQNVTIAISEETYNALRSGAKIVESYLDKDGNAQTREINATLKQVGDGYTVTFASDKTAVYGLMTRTSSGGSSGSGSSYTSGQSFTTDLPADSINRVTVNGKKLDSKYYTVSSNGSGSIVTLTDAYLATLKAGKYTVKIENKTHVSTGTFTIKADGTLSSPRTADAGIALYAMLAVSSLMGTAVVSKKRRKA